MANCWETVLEILKNKDYMKEEMFAFFVLKTAMSDLGLWEDKWKEVRDPEQAKGTVVLETDDVGKVTDNIVKKFKKSNKKIKKFASEAKRACGISTEFEEEGKLGRAL